MSLYVSLTAVWLVLPSDGAGGRAGDGPHRTGGDLRTHHVHLQSTLLATAATVASIDTFIYLIVSLPTLAIID